jgi:glucokinase
MLCIEELMQGTVQGIGIGVPSLVDVASGTVYHMQNIPSWDEVPLGEVLRERFGVPVYVNNDANCFAIGEKYFGAGRAHANFVGLTLGTGIGGGVVVEDRLYEGRSCCAGEFGSIPYRDSIYEDYCSGKFFKLMHGSEGKTISDQARGGDGTALAAMHEFGEHLGNLIQTVLFAYDPEAVIFGGSIRRDFPLFESGIHASLARFPYPHCVQRLRLHVSELADSPVLGAAALYWDADAKLERCPIPLGNA